MQTTKLEQFLDGVVESLSKYNQEEFWPLSAKQIFPYFDGSEFFGVYEKVNKLRKDDTQFENIAELFLNKGLLLHFLVDFGIDLKVGNKFGFFNTSFNERVGFYDYMLRISEYLEKSAGEKAKQKISTSELIKVNNKNRKLFGKIKGVLFGLNWSLYYDLFGTQGAYSHSPFKYEYKSDKLMAIVDEQYNQKIPEVWPVTTKLPFDEIKLYCLYRPFDYKDKLIGKIITNENLLDKLEYICIESDGKKLEEIDLETLATKMIEIVGKQTSYVNQLSDLQKVDKAIMFTFHTLRKFFKKDWKNLYKEARKRIETEGDKYLNLKPDNMTQLTKAEIRHKFDPRNDDF